MQKHFYMIEPTEPKGESSWFNQLSEQVSVAFSLLVIFILLGVAIYSFARPRGFDPEQHIQSWVRCEVGESVAVMELSRGVKKFVCVQE